MFGSSMRNVLRLVLYNLLAVVVLLVLLEGVVRIFIPEITPTGTDRRLFQDNVYGSSPGLRPETTGQSNGQRFTVNAHGFWAYTAGTNPKLDAWLLLGDSATMGIGVAPDSTFAGRLATIHDTVNVLNPSLIGYSSRDYVNILTSLLEQPSPAYKQLKRVTVFWCLNDVYAGDPVSAEPGQQIRELSGSFLTFLRQHVHTYHWLKAVFFDRARTYFEHDERLYTDAPSNLGAAASDLTTLHQLAEQHDIRFEVVILPYAYQLREPNRTAPQDILATRLAERAIPFADALPFLQALPASPTDLYLYGDGIHFSTLGHKALASFVVERLR